MSAVGVTRIDLEGWDDVVRLDLGGAVAFLAIHALVAGRAFGGIRIRPYASERYALDDALALSRAMSRKVAVAGIEGGGAKTVVIEPREDRAGVVRRLGEHVESLGGRYHCGGDLGFGAEDDRVLRSATRYVACGDLAAASARSVAEVMRAVAAPRVVAIQGLGAIGAALASMLVKDGVRVIGADVRDASADARVERVSTDELWNAECDVWSPCAAGGVLDEAAIARLRCRAVCGGANNPLATDADADRLLARGIEYVPDFIANAGATVVGASTAIGEVDRIEARMAALPALALEVIARAHEQSRSPHHVAIDLADARIAQNRPH